MIFLGNSLFENSLKSKKERKGREREPKITLRKSETEIFETLRNRKSEQNERW